MGPGVKLGSHATLLPHVVLYPGVQAGSHFFAHAHAVVRENCILGDNVTLENGAIVGSDGFGFAKNEKGHWEKIPQSGPVRLGNRVDVQANATIDRATVGATEIGDGSKVDNLVQVGHGSRVGENTLLCAQTGLAGSSVIGNNVILAGQTGIAGHCSVGDGVILTAQSAVSHDVPPGKIISGSPGFDNRIWLRAVTIFQRLPELLKRLDRVEKQVSAITHQENPSSGNGNRRMKNLYLNRAGVISASCSQCSQPAAIPIMSRLLSKTGPAAQFSCSRLIIPAPASAMTPWMRAEFFTIGFNCAAAVH